MLRGPLTLTTKGATNPPADELTPPVSEELDDLADARALLVG